MIPEKLVIQGFLSYYEEAVIDFNELTQANLFGIFGKVGSGKSAILDAITFTLYDRTERLKKGDKIHYNLLNLKSNSAKIEFYFYSGAQDQSHFKFSKKLHRNSKNHYDVSVKESSHYLEKDGEWIPEERSIEEITGLTYENFMRTIIIPQGKFQNFLQLKGTSKSAMMQELFNLDRFDIYEQTKSLLNKANQEIALLQQKIEDLGNLDPEQINAKQKTVKELTKEITILEKTLKEQRQTENELQFKEKAFKQLQDLTAKFNNKKQQEKEFSKLQEQVNFYQQAAITFKEIFATVKNLQQEVNSLQQKEKELNAALNSSQDQFTTLKNKLEKASKAYSLIDQEKEKIAELENLLLQKKVEQKKAEINQSLKIADQYFTTLDQEKEKLNEQIKKQQEQLNELSQQKSLYTELLEIQNYKQSEEALLLNQKELEKIINEMENLASSFTADFTANEKIINQELSVCQQQTKILLEEKSQLDIKSYLANLGEELKEGTPCPLCGASSHPQPISIAQQEEEKALLQEKFLENQKAEKNWHQLSQKISASKSSYQLLESKVKQEEKDLRLKEEKLAKNNLWLAKDLTAVNEKISFLKEEITKEKELQKNLLNDSKQLEGKNFNYQKAQDRKNNLEKEQFSVKEKLKDLENKISAQLKNQFAQTAETDLQKIIQQKETEIEQINQQYNSLKEEELSLSSKLATIKANVSSNKILLTEKTKLSQVATENLEKELKAHQQTREAVEKILLHNFDITAENKKINSFFEELRSLEKEIAEKEKIAANFSETELFTLSTEIEKNDEKKIIFHKEQNALEQEISKISENISTAKKLKKEFKKMQARAENLQTICNLTKGKGFVQYISEIFLQEICVIANKRFQRMTEQALCLELDENNDFHIRDYLNNGETRSAKTLSGGQSFQASLSLALALSEVTQKNNSCPQNFFFLDEGFGSLDNESLQQVFKTLKLLKNEKRIVGIISHVEELQQQTPLFLNVRQTEKQGSIIEKSWL